MGSCKKPEVRKIWGIIKKFENAKIHLKF